MSQVRLNRCVKKIATLDEGKHNLNAGETRRVFSKVVKLMIEDKDFARDMMMYALATKENAEE